ncbi:AMP-binding protein [Streptomyces sp. NPDC088254]|uniref:AMP-binding protein n=1 Tax=Streptomyces sp. NPDC088254 TaxID=3365847 RepID=UPI0038142111
MIKGTTAVFRAARDLLLDLREDHDAAVERFRWPRFEHFNWALDWFDVTAHEHEDRLALLVDTDEGSTVGVTYAELARRSDQVANWLRSVGVQRGSRMIVMLDNQQELWETLLAGMKLGAVIVPTYTTVSAPDLADRVARAGVSHLVTTAAVASRIGPAHSDLTRIAVGPEQPDWLPYSMSAAAPREFTPDAPTRAEELLFLYFTSGTTAKPKMVAHTHLSYPVGHLSGMYLNGLRPGDRHLNISAPGWAKHAWSSFFVPFTAEATLIALDAERHPPASILSALSRHAATTCCAPPTTWRALIQEDLKDRPVALREAVSVGEPLSPEVIEQVQKAWGITVRDGYGQTETTAQIGNTPGLPVRLGAMGRALPGYRITLVDRTSGEPSLEGEICVDLTQAPAGMMTGYLGDEERTVNAFADALYHTGDLASRDADGYITYIGRLDDVFKSSGHRISPFELENVLAEHPEVAEAAVVGVPGPSGALVPKAYVTLVAGSEPTAAAARSILAHAADRLAPHQRIIRLEFRALPKTTSGKIRRADLRGAPPTAGMDFSVGEVLTEGQNQGEGMCSGSSSNS